MIARIVNYVKLSINRYYSNDSAMQSLSVESTTYPVPHPSVGLGAEEATTPKPASFTRSVRRRPLRKAAATVIRKRLAEESQTRTLKNQGCGTRRKPVVSAPSRYLITSLPHCFASVPHVIGETLFVTEGGHGIQPTGPQCWQIARQDSHCGESGGGQDEGRGIVGA
jgi:hypothetical protein